MNNPQDQTHVHDYKPTKAGTYWKVCQCGARKHFAQDQTQAELRRILENYKEYVTGVHQGFQPYDEEVAKHALLRREQAAELRGRIDELNALYVAHNRHFETDSCDIIKARISELQATKPEKGE